MIFDSLLIAGRTVRHLGRGGSGVALVFFFLLRSGQLGSCEATKGLEMTSY